MTHFIQNRKKKKNHQKHLFISADLRKVLLQRQGENIANYKMRFPPFCFVFQKCNSDALTEQQLALFRLEHTCISVNNY